MMRIHLYILIALGMVLGACAGSSRNVSETNSPFTRMPRGNEDQEALFQRADQLFHSGDMVGAQVGFGTLFVLNPAFRGGLPEQAVNATCERMQVNCDLVMGRLEMLREVYANRWGAPSQWVPAQQNDYAAILQCYEYALLDEPLEAARVGSPVTRSPDPYFAASAQRCVRHVQGAVDAQAARRQADAAFEVWVQNEPCMNQGRQALLATYNAGNWEAFVAALPAYRRCSEPLQQVIDSGALAGDPRVGMGHDIVWSDMSEVDAILEDNADVIRITREGLVRLDRDPNYQRFITEFDAIEIDESRKENEIASLEAAMANLSGGARGGVQRQIEMAQGDLIGIRSRKREVMASINRLRRDAGLEARERP